MGCKRKELLPELFLELPEVGCPPSEGGAVYLAEGGEPLAVVTAEKRWMPLSVSSPRNYPTISMVRTSESESLGAGPR
jgi:hypothetical protein